MPPAAATALLGLALAIGAPTAWAVSRPEAAAGAPVHRVLEGPDDAVPPPSSGPPALPPVTVREAAPVAAPAAPAPVRLDLAGLGVTAPVDPVGVADDGQMELPDDVARVGWYRFGPAPGDDGNAVLAGHVDDAEQGPGAIFAREGPPRLVVLTCGGPFLPEYRSYRDNVVVVAEPLGGATP